MPAYQKLFVSFLLSVSVVLLSACGGAEGRKAEYMEQAETSFQEKDYDKAKLGYKNVIQIEPKDIDARLGLAKVLVATQQWREAAGAYQSVLDIDPENLQAAIELGKLFLIARASEQASEQLEKVLAVNPEHVGAKTLQAAILSQQGQNSKAIDILKPISSANPEDHDATVLYASLLNQTGKYDEAIAVLDRALGKTDKPNDLLSIKAIAYSLSGERDKAIEQFELLITKNPDDFTFKQRLVAYLLRNDKAELAETRLRSYIDQDDENIEARKALIDLLVKLKKVEDAELALKAYIEDYPSENEFKMGLARLYLLKGEPDKAVEELSAIIAKDPDGPAASDANVQLARIDLQAGKTERVKERLDKVLSVHPNKIEALLMRGRIALSEGRPVDAINDIRPVLNNDPDNVDVMRLLASAHVAANELPLAESYLKQLVRRLPSELSLKNSLADVYQKSGKSDAAISLRQEIQLVEPNSHVNLLALAKLYLATARYDDLDTVSEMLIGLPKGKASGYFFKGMGLQGANKHGLALAEFDKSLEAEPTAVEPVSAKVKSLVATEKKTEAIAWLKKQIKAEVAVPLCSNLLAEVYLLDKQFDQARQALETAISQSPSWITPRKNLALSYRAQGKPEQAIEVLKRAITEVDDAGLLRIELAQLMEATKDVDGAIEQYQWLYDNGKSMIAANNLAMLLVTYKEDEASLERAATIAETLRGSANPMFMDTLGWVYLKRQQVDLALPLLKEAANRVPDVPQINYHLAIAYDAMQNKQSAISSLEKALETDATFVGRKSAEQLLASLKSGS